MGPGNDSHSFFLRMTLCETGTCSLPCSLRANICPIRQTNGQDLQFDRASTVPSPFLDIDTPKSVWIYHKMAASLPFADRVFRPFPVLFPFPPPFPHRVAGDTAVQPPLTQRAPTVIARQSTVLLPCQYRPGAARPPTLRHLPITFSYMTHWCIDTLGRIYLSLIQCSIGQLSIGSASMSRDFLRLYTRKWCIRTTSKRKTKRALCMYNGAAFCRNVF